MARPTYDGQGYIDGAPRFPLVDVWIVYRLPSPKRPRPILGMFLDEIQAYEAIFELWPKACISPYITYQGQKQRLPWNCRYVWPDKESMYTNPKKPILPNYDSPNYDFRRRCCHIERASLFLHPDNLIAMALLDEDKEKNKYLIKRIKTATKEHYRKRNRKRKKENNNG